MADVEPTPDMIVYRMLMSEIKGRLAVAREDIANTSVDEGFWRLIIRVESCVLQARIICELIALSCLAIHERYERSVEGSKEYRPGKIFAKLADINEDFFPKAIRISEENGRKRIDYDKTEALTRDKLIKFYGGLGDLLHRGNLKKLTGTVPREYDVAELQRWFLIVFLFLENHCINVEGTNDAIIVQMHGGEERSVLVSRGTMSSE